MTYGRLLLVCVASVALMMSAPAQAHVIEGKNKWLITGSTYDKKPESGPRTADRKDPISVIWKGPNGAVASIGAAMDHTNAHWTERRIREKYPRGKEMKPRTKNPLCTAAQFVFMRDGNGVNSGKWSSSRGYMSTNGACGNQYHIRLWNDAAHADFFGASHRFDFVLAPIHHDHVVSKCVRGAGGIILYCRPDHVGDVPWDSVRTIYWKTMRPEHCTKLHWRVNPESEGFTYGKYKYSGVVSRISFRHRSAGCAGA